MNIAEAIGMRATSLSSAAKLEGLGGRIIDCDVHNDFRTVEELEPFLEAEFAHVLTCEETARLNTLPIGSRAWLHPENYGRTDAVAPGETIVGSDYALLERQLLAECNVGVAILTGGAIFDIGTLANGRYASALCQAHNDWTIARWLARDPRLRGSIAVAAQDPTGACAEIERLGARRDMAQVLIGAGSTSPFGEPEYWEIWETAARFGLPIAVHVGAQGGANRQPTACGAPTFFWECHALFGETAMGHVASLIAHGVFERLPDLRFIFVELGIAWLPSVAWRLDQAYALSHSEGHQLAQAPSKYIERNIRLTTQPLEIPRAQPRFWDVMERLGGRRMLMFSTDYPHWDFDDPRKVAIPAGWASDVFVGNAQRTYGEKVAFVSEDEM